MLSRLEGDANSWLNVAKEMRDHSTHRHSVPRVFYVGGDDDGKVMLQDPRTKAQIPGDQINVFGCWQSEMTDIIKCLRSSAVQEWQSNQALQADCLHASRSGNR